MHITLPEFKVKELEVDGTTECLLTPWMRSMILSVPGYPKAISHPPSIRYEVRPTPGRGLGIFATEDVEAGALVIAERPLMVRMVWGPLFCDNSIPFEERRAMVSCIGKLSVFTS